MKLSQSIDCGQTVPRRRQSRVTCAAPPWKAVRMLSRAKAPIPRITTRWSRQCTSSQSPASPRRTTPRKSASPRSVRLRGTPSRRLVHTTTVPLRTSKGAAAVPHTPTTRQLGDGDGWCCRAGTSCTPRTSHPRNILSAREVAPSRVPSAGASTSPCSSRSASTRISEWCEWFVLGAARRTGTRYPGSDELTRETGLACCLHTPPTRLLRSSTTTRAPACAKRLATINPASPAPTTSTSAMGGGVRSGTTTASSASSAAREAATRFAVAAVGDSLPRLRWCRWVEVPL